MPDWAWVLLAFAFVILVGVRYFKHVAGGKPEPHAMLDWGILLLLLILGLAVWQSIGSLQKQHQALNPGSVAQNLHPLEGVDVCSKNGQAGGPRIQSAPCGPGHTQQGPIDPRHNDPLPRPESASLPDWMKSEVAQDRYNQCVDVMGDTPEQCRSAEALYQCLKAGGTMASCGS